MNPQTELFKKSKEELLLEWCKRRGYVSTAMIMQYGLDFYYLRASRTIRDFVQEGKVKKLSKDEVLFRGMSAKMAWYQVTEEAWKK